jgi:FkbM family methyltransferase
MSTKDQITARLKLVRSKISSFLSYRRTYSNYLTVIWHHIKGDFPVEALLRQGKQVKLISAFQAYNIAQLQLYPGLRYNIENDEVTVSYRSDNEGNETKVKLYGGVNNGEVVECFMKGAYGFLPVKGKTVIDIGSNIGDSSIYFALRGAKKVISLEPFLKSYEAAAKNVTLNNLSDTVTLLLAGCAAKRGYITIDPHHNSNVATGIHDNKADVSGHGIRIPLLTLENILTKAGTPGDLVLKMDCEGCEYESILNSSRELLRRFSHIQLEYHRGYTNLKDKLEKNGFTVSLNHPIKSGPLYIGYIQAKRN